MALKYLTALLGLVMLSGCFPTIESPPLRSDDMAIPAGLCGNFDFVDEEDPDQKVTLVVAPKDNACTSITATMTASGAEERVQVDVYEGEPVIIGDAMFLSLRLTSDSENSPWFIVRAYVSDAALTLSFMHDERTLEAVRSGAIAGTITGPSDDPSVHITASAEVLAAFLASDAGRALFNEPGSGPGPEKVEGIIIFRRTAP